MSDYNPPTRPGYTKGGKSLKAVRRYYALKESSRKKRSPETKDEEDQDRPRRGDRSPPSSRRKRSPDDDKLSKRIAVELRTQQEANEKRAKHQPVKHVSPTDRPGPEIIHQPQETGPVFLVENQEPIRQPKSAKSVRSLKSVKSLASSAPTTNQNQTYVFSIGFTAIGCVMTCLIIALVFMITWLFMFLTERNRYGNGSGIVRESSLNSISWLAATSILVVLAVPYWLKSKSVFRHALVCLTLMILSTFSIILYIFFSLFPAEGSGRQPYFKRPNPLGDCLSMTFLIYHLLSVSFMTRQLLNLVSGQIGEKSADRATEQPLMMSQYLAPR